MPIGDLKVIIDRIGSHEGLVDLHGFGEPLLDETLPEKISLILLHWPQAEPRIFTTLGVRMKPTFFWELLEAGLRHIEVSFYGFDRDSYQQIHKVDRFELARENLIRLGKVARVSSEKLKVIVRAFPTHKVIKQPRVDFKQIDEFRSWLREIGVSFFRERPLHNYGNGRNYNMPDKNFICSIVWGYRKRILQVTWDLYVIPCCFDFNAEIKLGNLHTQNLEEIFYGERYLNFIHSHLENRLEDYLVCQTCERCHRA